MDKKKALIKLTGPNMARSNRVLRVVKMLQPIHPECQHPYRRGWWTACEEAGHEPYLTKQEVDVSTPVYDHDEDGDLVLVDTKTKRKLVVHPNIVQVPLSRGVGDARAPERFAREKGFRHMEEMGYSPLCQMLNCWQEAKLVTNWGEFCSTEHARLVAADEDEIALEVYDQRKRNRQLRAIDISA